MRSLIAIVVLVLASVSGTGFCATPADIDAARNKGLKWLFENQAGDGSWRSKAGTEIPATASATQALATAQLRGPNFARAVSWLANARTSSVDSLARQIVALSTAGLDVKSYVTQLQAQTNKPGRAVWGAYDHFGTSFPDTPLGIAALRVGQNSSYLTNDVRNAFYCEVLRAQRPGPDYSWPFTAPVGGTTAPPAQLVSGSILPTAYALIELHKFNGSTGWSTVNCLAANQTPPGTQTFSSTHVVPAISNGVAWLLTKRDSLSGGFGDAAPTTVTVLETALAYLALDTLQPANTVTERSAALDYLLQQQNPANGSWGNGDALITAFVLSVLPPPATALVDTDGDGIPDAVEVLMGKSTTVADSRPAAGTGSGGGTQGLSSTGSIAESMALLCPETYQTPAVAGGTGSYTYTVSAGSLPAGLTLAAATGVISGKPASVGDFGFIYTVKDSSGNSVSLPGRIKVALTDMRCIIPLLILLLDDD